MWMRDQSKPTPYNGIEFRSGLEARVAEQLDALGVVWRYEVDAHKAASWFAGSYEPAPPRVRYLPDFAVMEAPEYLQLPLWVEVKPASLLYAVRDHLGCPERFTDDFISDVDSRSIEGAGLEEIWKPKKLAEVYERDVLVVSEINRNRTLSILMKPGQVVLSRRHPAVNHRQVIADRARAEREAQWKAHWEARVAERERQRARELAQWVHHVQRSGRPARYGDQCLVCGIFQPAAEILIARDAYGGWRATCRSHISREAS